MDLGPKHLLALNALISRDPVFSQLIIKAPRGGGKTKLVGTGYAFKHYMDPTLKVSVHSGSYEQANYCYAYYKPLITNPDIIPPDWLLHEPTKSLTEFRQGGFMRILTASELQIRGGHPDEIVVDEAVLIKQEHIDAFWPSVDTSQRPKRVVLSTASPKISLDWFLNIWQNCEKLEFKRYEWEVEDCPWINQEDLRKAQLLYGIDNETFQIEFLGKIAERRGRVFDSLLIDGEPDPLKSHHRAVVDPDVRTQYPLPMARPLTEWSLGLDWGFTHPTVMTVWEMQGEIVYGRECRSWSRQGFTEIREEIRADYPDVTVYPDASYPGENEELRNMGLSVDPVIFSKEKEQLISQARWRFENGLLKIPDPEKSPEWFTLVQELKSYHYDKNGKPEKVNDDFVDSMLCGLKPFMVGMPDYVARGARRR